MKPVSVEEKIYRALGVKQYCRFLVWIKLHYDQWRGKTDTDNYFLKSGKLEDLHFLQQQLIKNAKIHGFGGRLVKPTFIGQGFGIHGLWSLFVGGRVGVDFGYTVTHEQCQ